MKSNIFFIALTKTPERERSIFPSRLYGSGFDQGPRFPFVTPGFESLDLQIYRKRGSVVRVEFLQMVKPMVVGFCSLSGCCYSE